MKVNPEVWVGIGLVLAVVAFMVGWDVRGDPPWAAFEFGSWPWFEIVSLVLQLVAAGAAAAALWLNRLDRIERDAPHVVLHAGEHDIVRNIGQGTALGVVMISRELELTVGEGDDLISVTQERDLPGDYAEVLAPGEYVHPDRYQMMMKEAMEGLIAHYLPTDQSGKTVKFFHTVLVTYVDRAKSAQYEQSFVVVGSARVSLGPSGKRGQHELRLSRLMIEFVEDTPRRRNLLKPLFDMSNAR